MKLLWYVKTYREYLKTKKGSRDARDYAKAAVCFLLTTIFVLIMIVKLTG